jgi:hypothetical protein
MNGRREDHERIVVDQFTRQANQFREFAKMPGKPVTWFSRPHGCRSSDMLSAARESDGRAGPYIPADTPRT